MWTWVLVGDGGCHLKLPTIPAVVPRQSVLLCLLLLLLPVVTALSDDGGGDIDGGGHVAGALLTTWDSHLCAPPHILPSITFGPPDPYNFTVCALVHQLSGERNERQSGFFYYSVNNTNITARTDFSIIKVTVEDKIYVFNGSLDQDVWNPVCFGYNINQSEAWFVSDGKFLDLSVIENNTDPHDNSSVCIGIPTSYMASTIEGYVAAVSVVAGVMDEQDAHLVTCDAVVYASLAASTLDNTWYEDGETWRTEFKREELCSKSTHNFWLKQSCDYLECNKVCTGFGGHLLTVPSHLENLTTSVPLMCPTDETQVSWTSHDYQEDGPLTAKCPTLLLNGTSAFRFCLSELECSLCQAPMWLRFMLYGDIRGFDRAFFLKSQPGGNIYFEGLTTSIISIRGSSWVLSSRIHHRFWQLGHSSWPIGRRVWRSGTTNTTLTLTSCTVLQFSSDDGHCISREKRCNSLVDFPDRSDELGCLDRVVQKNNSYEHLVPPTHNNENETDVYYWFNVKNIREITTTNAIANIDMSVILYWSDPRLVMWDAGNTGISFFICDDIWHPKLGIRAGYENKGQEVNYEVYTSQCAVIHSLSHHQYDMDDPYMGRFVYGEERNLTKLMQLLLALPCNFELHRYPFGQHQCNATFYLKIFEGDKELKTILESGEIYYSGKKNLLDYKLLKVTFENTSSFATLTLHLQSQCDYHMLTSFAPSALMFIISYSSLFFPMAFFSDRIMVSLTALLVLAALFAQASDSYVKTPYYKLIDVWYATMICLCFTVVMTNVVTNCLQHMPQEFTYSLVSTRDGDGTKRGTPANSPRRAVYFNTVSKVLHIALFTSLVTVFIMFATDVI